jgi:hypothetical protein
MLKAGEDFADLCENYVIFITENDVLGSGRPIYHIDRVISEDNVQFEDGEHIIYVNGSMKAKDTALGKLMSDLYCTKADDMCYEELSKRVRQYKETEEGVDTMCDILDEMKNDVRTETRIENARKMLEIGKMTFDEIAICSGLSIEKVRELAGNKSA